MLSKVEYLRFLIVFFRFSFFEKIKVLVNLFTFTFKMILLPVWIALSNGKVILKSDSYVVKRRLSENDAFHKRCSRSSRGKMEVTYFVFFVRTSEKIWRNFQKCYWNYR